MTETIVCLGYFPLQCPKAKLRKKISNQDPKVICLKKIDFFLHGIHVFPSPDAYSFVHIQTFKISQV